MDVYAFLSCCNYIDRFFFNAIYKDKIDLPLNVLDRLVISRKQIEERTTFPNRSASTNPRPY